MPIRKYKPTSPGRRFQTVQTFDEITTTEPYKPLIEPLHKSGGRNSTGEVTSWWRGGGHKRTYRIIDFKRDKHGIPGKVATIEYDPNRSARIALITYADGEKRYILQPAGPEGRRHGGLGRRRPTSCRATALPLKKIPLGTMIHNVELKPGKGGQLARSAGAAVQLVAREGEYATVKMPSSEVRQDQRRVLRDDRPGRQPRPRERVDRQGGPQSRWLGKRPHVRGVAMNPVDHPLGGGEGKTSGGRHPVTPWGIPTKGYKTRNNKRTDGFIVTRRQK